MCKLYSDSSDRKCLCSYWFPIDFNVFRLLDRFPIALWCWRSSRPSWPRPSGSSCRARATVSVRTPHTPPPTTTTTTRTTKTTATSNATTTEQPQQSLLQSQQSIVPTLSKPSINPQLPLLNHLLVLAKYFRPEDWDYVQLSSLT